MFLFYYYKKNNVQRDAIILLNMNYKVIKTFKSQCDTKISSIK